MGSSGGKSTKQGGLSVSTSQCNRSPWYCSTLSLSLSLESASTYSNTSRRKMRRERKRKSHQRGSTCLLSDIIYLHLCLVGHWVK